MVNIARKLVLLGFTVNPCQWSYSRGACLSYSTTANFLLAICYEFETLHLKTDTGWEVWITSREKQ